MNLRCAKGSGTARVAIIGAATPSGTRLREALAAAGVPGARVELYGTTHGEVVLSEYDGEARLIQEPDLAAIASRDLVFLCEASDVAGRVAPNAGGHPILVDLVRGALPRGRSRLVHMGVNPAAAEGHEGVLAVPHELTGLLVDVLGPLDAALHVVEATAVIVRPASDFGDEGVDELREQTVRLLNFAQVPRNVFGRQLAFNVIPQSVLSGDEQVLARRVRDEVMELLGWPTCRLALSMLTVPVFYGHGVQLRVRLGDGVLPAAVCETLSAHGLIVAAAGNGSAVTPLDVSSERATVVADVGDDGLGGAWIWAIAGETQARAAELAVRLADALCDL